MKIKFVPVFLVTSIVAMVTMVIMSRLGAPTQESLHMLRAAREADSKAIANDWANHTYVPVTNAVFKGELGGLLEKARGISLLDDRQKPALSEELMVFFRAYSAGTYAAYHSFRFPDGIEFNWKTNKYGSIDEVLKKPPGFGIPYAYHRWHVQIETKRNNYDSLPKEEKFKIFQELFAGETQYSNYFSAACFEQSRVIINNYTNTITKPWKIDFYPPSSFLTNSASIDAPFPNMGYFSQKSLYSLVKFADSVDSVRDQFGKVTVADCYFFVQRPAPDPVLPVIARFYWNPNAMQWLPDDVVVCNLWNKGSYWPLF